MALIRSTRATAPPPDPADDPRAALAEGRASARRDAARRLAADPQAVAPLAERLAVEGDTSVREAILGALARIGSPEAVAHLVGLLDSEDVWLRNAAIEVLQDLDGAVLDALAASLSHPASDRRIFAVNVLAALRHPAAGDLALRALAEDPHVNVCAAALDVLAEIGTPAMVPAIEGAKARFPDEPFLHFAARAAIRRIA
ncbi:HEAT repeat domain-containing protein [Methylobacterium sp. ID0610]|uniref:HEAT repeat domain-containing protein n=1 Tax=Methylobacterium carpenticola TaxID=3344827 RepID=UPI00367C7E6C